VKGLQADTGFVVLAQQLENAMQTVRLIVTSLRSKVDDTAFAVCLAAFAVALAGFAGSAVVAGARSANDVTATAGQKPTPVAPTIADVNGVPVYRMPAISVSSSRTVEMARIEQEDQRARASDTAGSSS
jgi:hypothetical protein